MYQRKVFFLIYCHFQVSWDHFGGERFLPFHLNIQFMDEFLHLNKHERFKSDIICICMLRIRNTVGASAWKIRKKYNEISNFQLVFSTLNTRAYMVKS